MKPQYYLIIIIIFTVYGVFSQITTGLQQIPYASQEINVDGDLSDWKTYFEYSFADTLHSFISKNHKNALEDVFPEQFDFDELLLPKSRNKVIFRAFWNGTSFNCAYIVRDKHLFAEKPSLIDKPMVHLNDGIELYIDTKNERTPKMDIDDYQFLIDIKNEREVFKGDLKEILADTVDVPKDFAQNILFFSAVKLLGTINDEIEDSLYIIEISIPFAAIGVVPESGMKMHLDVCVNDIDYPVSETNFIEEASTAMWPFSWSGYSDFGYPVYWKEVQFSGGPNWYEIVSEQYKMKWLNIYVITVALSLLLIFFLILRVRKLRRLPQVHEIDEKKITIQPVSEHTGYNDKVLQKATQYIIDHQTEQIRSEDLAGNLGMSLRSFQRITREELQVTPTNYIYIVKLNLAADFLKSKAGNVTEAAYRFGFSDPSYFSKIFKKHFGMAPSDFAKNPRE
jgi:AraC-like DNA-binding protein